MRPDNQLVIGLDIGGTKIYAGVIDRQGKIYATAKMKTRAHTGFPATFERIKRCIRQVVQTAGLKISAIQALGVGAPGPLNPTTGVVIDTPNLGWKNVPLQTTLQQEFGIPVKIDNDVNVGVWGEHIFGAGQGIAHLIGLFIGTGLGGGVIIDGKLLHGFNQNAGELGHVIINPNGPRCNCGVRGHLEAYVSKTGIDQYLRQAISKGKTTYLKKYLKNEISASTSSDLAEAYHSGDKLTRKAIHRSARYLSYGLASFLNIFNPEMVILGGGLIEALGSIYLERVQKLTQKYVFPVAFQNVKIVPALLADDAVILGASVLAFEALAESRGR